jgi:hypothetical protein
VLLRSIVADVTVVPAGLVYFFICLTSQNLDGSRGPALSHGLTGSRENTGALLTAATLTTSRRVDHLFGLRRTFAPRGAAPAADRVRPGVVEEVGGA